MSLIATILASLIQIWSQGILLKFLKELGFLKYIFKKLNKYLNFFFNFLL